MSSLLAKKKILFGITGSIAAYKTVDWVRSLVKEEAQVKVVMTEAATRFVTQLTFAALSGNRVYESIFDPLDQELIPHINLAREADLILVAPATAQTIGRLAHGLAEDLLSAIVLASQAKIMICPAMNSQMYNHPATKQNLATLKKYGYTVIEPDSGLMACGEEGPGRLPEWPMVYKRISESFTPQDLRDKSILITAGPTHEPLDPVRFLGNRSSGKMGYALAATASRRGADVTLVSGPVNLEPPPGVKTIQVKTAREMHHEVLNCFNDADIVIKAAAVADFRPEIEADQKIKKSASATSLSLTPNPDILFELGQLRRTRKKPLVLVGFAAESDNHLEEGRRKLKEKNLDLLAVNDIMAADSGFDVDTNRITLLARNGSEEELPLLSKEDTAMRIWDQVIKLQDEKSS